MINKKIILVVLGTVLAGSLIFFLSKLLFNREQGPATLRVNSTPLATVFLDSLLLGKTPNDYQVKAGEHTIKLVPESSSGVSSWQTKIKLAPGVLTYVNRYLGDQDLTSAGEILTLEKISGKSAEIAVLSTPDGAQVSLDGQGRGMAPVLLEKINPGDYNLELSATGFNSRQVKVKTTAGFKLVASIQLALSSLATPSAAPSPTSGASPTPGAATPKPTATPKPSGTPAAELPRPYVKILETNTDGHWLNVRSDPSATGSANVAAKVYTGETYPLLGTQSGWYKIRYQGTNEGWISGQYAEKFE